MKFKNILMSCVMIFGSMSLSGCYTQLSMFYPEPEMDDTEQFYSYSSAGPLRSIGMYAQTGAGQSLGMAYQTMYNRFSGFMGYGNKYSYYNPYYYGGYYNETYTLGGYTMNIPYVDNKTPRTWTRDRDTDSPNTNLNITRTSTNTTESSNTNVSSTRSSSTSSSSSSSGGRRATRRN